MRGKHGCTADELSCGCGSNPISQRSATLTVYCFFFGVKLFINQQHLIVLMTMMGGGLKHGQGSEDQSHTLDIHTVCA